MIVAVCGSFDDLRLRHVRLLDEASHLGQLHVLLWSDQLIQTTTGQGPKFPQHERLYFLQSMRYVHQVTLVDSAFDPESLPPIHDLRPDIWAVDPAADTPAKRQFAHIHHLQYQIVPDDQLQAIPTSDSSFIVHRSSFPPRKVLVTGCYDWLHTGHIRFFEEVSELGDLYVVVGHDANIAQLKGPGHPLFLQYHRRYMVQSIRFVRQALISTGHGWLDAEPEIRTLKPDYYAVNEDGDKPEKREYCQQHGIEYVILKRLPKPGLPRRQSTILRGF